MTVTHFVRSIDAISTGTQAQLGVVEHDTSAKPPTIGLALAHFAEAIQTAKRAGITYEQAHKHLAVLWPVVPVEDADDAAV